MQSSELTERLKRAMEKNDEEWTDLKPLHEALVKIAGMICEKLYVSNCEFCCASATQNENMREELEAALKEMGV